MNKYFGREDYAEGSLIPTGFPWGNIYRFLHPNHVLERYISLHIVKAVYDEYNNPAGKARFIAHLAWGRGSLRRTWLFYKEPRFTY